MEEKIDNFFKEKKKEAGVPASGKETEKDPDAIESFFRRKKDQNSLKSNSYE